MIEKGKISALQMALLMYATITTTAILTVPVITYRHAEQDMWISPIWGSLAGFLLVFIVCKLNKLYPEKTPIQICEHILGRIPTLVLGFIYTIHLIYGHGQTFRQYGDFLVGAFFNQTPLFVVMGSLALASSLAVRAGLEVLGRLSALFVPVIFLLWLLIVLLLIPELDAKNMLPVMEKGMLPSLRGAVGPQSWNSMFVYMSFLLPFLNNREQGMKWGMIAVIAIMSTLLITNLTTLFLFGNITGQFVYPVMSASRYIRYADFLENMESVVMAIWIGGGFVKIAFHQFVIGINVAHWLHLSEYKSICLPIGLLVTIFGIWVFPNTQEMGHFFDVIYPFQSAVSNVGMPIILLLLALYKHRNRQKTGK